MANIIDFTTLCEAQAAAHATERLNKALCIAAEATAAGALNEAGRLMLTRGEMSHGSLQDSSVL